MPPRPTLLALAALALACAGPLAGGAVAQEDAEPSRPLATSPSPARVEAALLSEMNRVRVARGRVALRVHGDLRRPARTQSRYLLRIGDLSHEGADGAPFWTRLVAAGFPRTRLMAENLAMVSGCELSGARRTVAMWMRSPGHRANLLNPRFRWVGPGVAVARDCSETYLTADYGS